MVNQAVKKSSLIVCIGGVGRDIQLTLSKVHGLKAAGPNTRIVVIDSDRNVLNFIKKDESNQFNHDLLIDVSLQGIQNSREWFKDKDKFSNNITEWIDYNLQMYEFGIGTEGYRQVFME